MGAWRKAFLEGLRSGTAASVLSTVILVAAGRVQPGHPAAPLNAISHWIWGERALREDDPSWRHTLAGYLIHHAASTFWATLHARAGAGRAGGCLAGSALADGLLTAAVACIADYKLTPERFRPGFEHRLSHAALLLVYAAFGVGIALGSRGYRRSGQEENQDDLRRRWRQQKRQGATARLPRRLS